MDQEIAYPLQSLIGGGSAFYYSNKYIDVFMYILIKMNAFERPSCWLSCPAVCISIVLYCISRQLHHIINTVYVIIAILETHRELCLFIVGTLYFKKIDASCIWKQNRNQKHF